MSTKSRILISTRPRIVLSFLISSCLLYCSQTQDTVPMSLQKYSLQKYIKTMQPTYFTHKRKYGKKNSFKIAEKALPKLSHISFVIPILTITQHGIHSVLLQRDYKYL